MLLTWSCKPIPHTEPVRVNRLDLALRGGGNVTVDLMDPVEKLFRVSGYGPVTDSTLAVYASSPSITLHERAVDSVWHDMKAVENALGRVKSAYGRLFPEKTFPVIYAIVSPFNQSVFSVDSIVYIGLNHYIGQTYEPYSYFPDYIRARKVPERLVPDVAEAIIRRDFPYSPGNGYPTALARLLYEGAVVEAEMQLTGISEQQALGYDDEQMKWLNKNERQLWETLAARKYLFSSDPQVASSLVSLAPFTSVIGQEVPGASGRFIGHRIVSAYLDRHAVNLSWLLSPEFYESETALADSGYK